MSDFKNSWKQTGTGLGGAFKTLGKTLIKTGKKGVDSAVEWAGREDAAPEQPIEAQYTENTGNAYEAEQPGAWTASQPEAQAGTVDPSMLVADEIKKLAALRDQGILTDEEFTARKRQLLNL